MQIREFPILNLNSKYFTIITIIIMNCCGLGPSRTVPLDLEDAFHFSIFVLVSPDHDDFLLSLPHVSSISVGTGRCLSLCYQYERFCLFVSPFWLGLQVVSKLSPVLLIISLHIFILFKIRTSERYLRSAFGVILRGTTFMFKIVFCQNVFSIV